MHRFFHFSFLLAIAFIVASGFCSCGDSIPSEYLQPKELEEVLYDYHVALGMLYGDMLNDENRAYNERLYKLAVLKKHNVSEEKFEKSMVYYMRHAEDLQKVYKSLSERVRAEAAQRTANIESIQSWQKARAETLAFKATLDALTDSETSLADRQRMVAEEIKKREEAEKELARKAIREGGDVDATNPEKMAESQKAFAKAVAEYRENAAKLDQLKDMQKKLEKEAPDTPRPSFAASDALSRVGGAFAPTAGSDLRELVNGSRQQLASLREIAANTKQRVSSSWQ